MKWVYEPISSGTHGDSPHTVAMILYRWQRSTHVQVNAFLATQALLPSCACSGRSHGAQRASCGRVLDGSLIELDSDERVAVLLSPYSLTI